ncbi:MAG TPA: accessory gene regulator B family protein [Firmicutes bacterium]|nr:accessory gene regulator B family protein [Bacillota bacterium]
MDKLAHWIVENIDREFQLDADKREQVEFGLKCLLTLLLSYTLIIVSSWVLGLFPGALIVAGALGLLRSFSGGAHASTSLRCAVIAIMYTNSLAYVGWWQPWAKSNKGQGRWTGTFSSWSSSALLWLCSRRCAGPGRLGRAPSNGLISSSLGVCACWARWSGPVSTISPTSVRTRSYG